MPVSNMGLYLSVPELLGVLWSSAADPSYCELPCPTGSVTTASGTTTGGAAGAASEDPAIKHMADLLDVIPQELLASAAAHCGVLCFSVVECLYPAAS